MKIMPPPPRFTYTVNETQDINFEYLHIYNIIHDLLNVSSPSGEYPLSNLGFTFQLKYSYHFPIAHD